MFIIATHAAFIKDAEDVFGPAHTLHNFLLDKNIPQIFIRHPIYGKFDSIFWKEGETYNIGGKNLSLWQRTCFELYQNIKVVMTNTNSSDKIIFVGIDPLNALSGVILKWIGKVHKCIFYTPDYTKKRYGNLILNSIYHFTDRIAVRFSDQVWCVSKAIINIRNKQGVAQNITFYLPNSPRLREVAKIKSKLRDTKTLVMTGNINKTLDYEMLIEAVLIISKFIPEIKLKIIGKGDYTDKLNLFVKKLKLDDHVFFLGSKNHDEVIKILKESAIGIALYSGEFATNYYGDSMKIREYLSCGLPVITTNVVETSQMIKNYQAGIIVKNNIDAIVKAVRDIYGNYTKYNINAYLAARDFDYDKMLIKPLKALDI